ncbi:MAG: TRAP transporter large permease [Rhodospirillales bacterium]|nr:TRAP transporter large permease [Rhodospirillales bacterium]
MTGIEVGIASIFLIVLLIYLGLYVPVALGLVSFIGVWILRGNIDMPISLLSLSVADTVSNQVFATVPLFALMGLFVSQAGIGKDVYEVANAVFYKIRGGLGIATVAANAVFAAITGSSIASATVFTRIAVPEMKRFHYTGQFSVGVVAGSSVLGMLIPPSAMLIIYAIVAEQSIGHMFMAGIIPGIVLSIAFGMLILGLAYFAPKFVGGVQPDNLRGGECQTMTMLDMAIKMFPVFSLIVVVLGGIYGGVVTPVEAGAAGSLVALIIALIKRRLGWRDLWHVLVETGHITAIILTLIIAASMYSRMLGVAALPTTFAAWLQGMDLGFVAIMMLYVVMMVFLGTILDTASIILIVVPLFLPAIEGFGGNLVWFGIVTVIGAEIGLLTPPLGLSCFAIKSTINDPDITLFDIFFGAFPFAVVMLLVLGLIIAFPVLSLALV